MNTINTLTNTPNSNTQFQEHLPVEQLPEHLEDTQEFAIAYYEERKTTRRIARRFGAVAAGAVVMLGFTFPEQTRDIAESAVHAVTGEEVAEASVEQASFEE